ncbi:MAG: hypothetical protein EXS12_06140 [Phycisphaerales bacterium]|nr:hypothetical protein [Phycisphaerales bacterium]
MALQYQIAAALCIVLHICGCTPPTALVTPAPTPAPTSAPSTSAVEINLANGLLINQSAGEVLVRGKVAIRQGFLEQLVCFKGTREHESLIVVNVAASHIHAALLAVGAHATHPGIWSRDKSTTNDLKLEPPAGDVLSVQVQYVMDGVTRRCDLGEWIEDARHQDQFKSIFVFAGSHFEADGRGGKRYTADVTGSIVGLVTFGDELVAYAQVIPDQAEIATPHWQANTARIPPEGSDVVLILKALTP